MSFENDIFISYAHIDNEPLTEGQKGWISDFHRALGILLAQKRGETAKIWRDEKLQGNDYFGSTIVEQFPKVALLVSILSPRYIKSEWCVKELQAFCKAAEQTGGVRLADKSRIFKVIKTPIERDKEPQEMQGLLGYEFYQRDQTGRPIEFSSIFGPDAERNYWAKLNDLAYDIYQLLEKISHNGNGAVKPPIEPTGVAVYLAETTFDMTGDRDKIKRELQQRGYSILPEQSLPPYNPAFEQAVRENLERCQLSIHPIGARYGMVPEGADCSVVVLQNELAVEQTRQRREFQRLVWMPVGLQAQEPRQEVLLKSLQDDAALLQTTLEDLKTIIQDKLNPQPQTVKNPIAEDGPVRVYLIYDQRDSEASDSLDDYLYEQGCEVIRPLFEGDEAEVRQDHQENLKDCDVVIIYCGNISEPWLRTKLGDLRKVYGYGRSKPMLAKAIYLGEPLTEQKQRWCRTREAQLIKNSAELEAFAAQIIQGGQR